MFGRANKKVFITLVVILLFCGVLGCTEFGKSADDSDNSSSIEPEHNYTNSIGMEFVKIPSGEFMMGPICQTVLVRTPSGEIITEEYINEDLAKKVEIKKPFYLGKFEVTQGQWREVMGSNPSYFEGDDLPVERVSWDEVQEFIEKLNEIEGIDKYRLPSEAEWEYACKAGTTTRYSFGDDEAKFGDYAWYGQNSGLKTHPVGQKKPNPRGLYDMHGNVMEWVESDTHGSVMEWINEDILERDKDGGVGSSVFRGIRGGGFQDGGGLNVYRIQNCGYAGEGYSNLHRNDLGFRVLREI
ncbi:formylglycine-generating enzyme family protein [Methanosarcina sp. T3]|uniref:formylglycine-generating enzyme family protein n=1 Tax=Methanosarcina sp. T3 TaxID=3439062 RepID=UPI003F87F658